MQSYNRRDRSREKPSLQPDSDGQGSFFELLLERRTSGPPYADAEGGAGGVEITRRRPRYTGTVAPPWLRGAACSPAPSLFHNARGSALRFGGRGHAAAV